jgi:predicted nucleic acid-binding protein
MTKRKRRYTLDANILIYAIDSKAGEKHHKAIDIVDKAIFKDCVLTLQVLGEFYFATTRKGKMSMEKAEEQVNDWQVLFPVVAATPECISDAMSLTRQHLVSFWDALLLITAKKNEVTHILSEDFQEGIILEEVTVINPFNIDNLFE